MCFKYGPSSAPRHEKPSSSPPINARKSSWTHSRTSTPNHSKGSRTSTPNHSKDSRDSCYSDNETTQNSQGSPDLGEWVIAKCTWCVSGSSLVANHLPLPPHQAQMWSTSLTAVKEQQLLGRGRSEAPPTTHKAAETATAPRATHRKHRLEN